MQLNQIWPRITEFYGDITRDITRNISILTRRATSILRSPTYSWGRADYKFWTKAYYCKVVGLEVSGLFIRPIVHKIPAWVLGSLPSFLYKSKTVKRRIEDWFASHHEDMFRIYEASLKHGDCFFVINADLSVTIVPPDCVDPIVDEKDYSKRIGWRIRQVFPHPDDGAKKMIVTDEYYIDRRVHTEEFTYGTPRKTTYPNVIGIIPVVHVANNPGEGEQFGHPEAEALLDLLHRYGQILEASVEGNILQGRPTPVVAFNTVQDLNAFWKRYSTKSAVRMPDGSVKETEAISIDLSDILTLSGATFTYESPGSFAQDAERILGLLFYLILEHLEIPEFVLGNAIEGSKASAETQMPVFEVFIGARQKGCTPWMLQTARVVKAYQDYVNVGAEQEDPRLQWQKLTQNGRMVMDAVGWAYENNLLDEETALELLPLEIENPEQVLKKAKKEAEKREEMAAAKLENDLKITAANTPKPEGPSRVRSGSNKEMDPTLEEELEALVV